MGKIKEFKMAETAINVKCSHDEKAKIKVKAKEAGFLNVSEYLRFIALNAEVEVTADASDLEFKKSLDNFDRAKKIILRLEKENEKLKKGA